MLYSDSHNKFYILCIPANMVVGTYGTVSGVLVLIVHNWKVFFVKLGYRNGYRKRAAAIDKHNLLSG